MRSLRLHLDEARENDELLRDKSVVLQDRCGDVNDGARMQVVGFAHDDLRLILPMDRRVIGRSKIELVGLFRKDDSGQRSSLARIGYFHDELCRVAYVKMRELLSVRGDDRRHFPGGGASFPEHQCKYQDGDCDDGDPRQTSRPPKSFARFRHEVPPGRYALSESSSV